MTLQRPQNSRDYCHPKCDITDQTTQCHISAAPNFNPFSRNIK